MELRQLRYFVAVAEERHFGRAAERLRMAQPGLSQQIKALERSLGVQLFDRRSRPIELTAQGRALLEQARVMIELADRAIERARVDAGDKGLLKVGTFVAGSYPVVDEILSEFPARFPGVELEVHLGTGPQTLEALNRRILDVAFIHAPFNPAVSPSYLRLGTVEILIALPEGHGLASRDRLRLEDLSSETFITAPRSVNPTLFDHVMRSLFGQARPPRSIEVADAAESSRLLLVAEGKGITGAVFSRNTGIEVPGVVYRHVEDPAPSFEFGLVWFDDHSSPIVADFVQLAREIAHRGAPAADGRLAMHGA